MTCNRFSYSKERAAFATSFAPGAPDTPARTLKQCDVPAFDEYLSELASAAPTPGGGSAATVVAALAAALVAMVARITTSRRRDAETAALAGELIAGADALRNKLEHARADDENAYAAVVAAQALPKAGADEQALRGRALQVALHRAASVPLHTASLALQTLELTERALILDNVHLASDLACAAQFGRAAVYAAGYNVRANHPYLKNDTLVAEQSVKLQDLERRAELAARHILDALGSAK